MAREKETALAHGESAEEESFYTAFKEFTQRRLQLFYGSA